MTTVVGVRFRKVGRVYYFDPGKHDLRKGTEVIADTQRGLEFGECVMTRREVEDEKIVPPLRKIIRIATPEDMETLRKNEQKEEQAAGIFLKKIGEHGLQMKLVTVEYTFDSSKIVFFFTADGRVDFRDLVRDLAQVFRTRIELRQVGVRDEAKLLGGLGVCGRPFCCASFLDEFQPVSIKMAKEQSLSLNPTKISGTCGRLMCCLKYEQDAYEDLLANTPRADSVVRTPQGKGTVTGVSLLRGQLSVRLDAAPDMPVKTFHKSEVTVLKGAAKQGRADAESEGGDALL
ncbi:MAG: stage 0 sporulation family protein [Oscillospiraceae bacterium]|nr:stage 0 sporulation family protein [Oscillospiraceae bacterium]